MKRVLVVIIALFVCAASVESGAASPRRRRPSYRRVPPPLVWHVETLAGDVVTSDNGDNSINPASVVKVATSMWALERLGPDFRFETRFFSRGTIDQASGKLRGDLVVNGAGDPDFQEENAFLVAQALVRLGVKEVRGNLIVNRKFWMGWENGSEGTITDPNNRAIAMATRLRQALDPRRWNGALRRAWRQFAAERGLPAGRPFRVAFFGSVGVEGDIDPGQLVLVHRSERLASALRRFNCFSNNDIERVGSIIGSPSELAGVVAARCAGGSSSVRLETTSGLGTNRLSPRTIVNMVRELRDSALRSGTSIEQLLPVSGCDNGTVTRFFPQLASGANVGAVVGKTGTLTTTDGGVSVLAGLASTGDGEYVFCVAAPHAEGKLKSARQAEERWLLAFIQQHGGPRPRSCSSPLQAPDADASVIVIDDQVATSSR